MAILHTSSYINLPEGSTDRSMNPFEVDLVAVVVVPQEGQESDQLQNPRPDPKKKHSPDRLGFKVRKTDWWYTNPSEKYESHFGWLIPIYGKVKDVPNHQTRKWSTICRCSSVKTTWSSLICSNMSKLHNLCMLIFFGVGSRQWKLSWLVVSNPLKNYGVRHLGWWHSTYMGKISSSHVPGKPPTRGYSYTNDHHIITILSPL